ncbi:MAG: hypothetical protein ABSB52_11365 [Acidimicrobiales bacterium]
MPAGHVKDQSNRPENKAQAERWGDRAEGDERCHHPRWKAGERPQLLGPRASRALVEVAVPTHIAQAAMGGADTIWARISGSPVGRRSAADTPAQAEVMAATSTAKHDRGGESITAVAEAAAR